MYLQEDVNYNKLRKEERRVPEEKEEKPEKRIRQFRKIKGNMNPSIKTMHKQPINLNERNDMNWEEDNTTKEIEYKQITQENLRKKLNEYNNDYKEKSMNKYGKSDYVNAMYKVIYSSDSGQCEMDSNLSFEDDNESREKWNDIFANEYSLATHEGMNWKNKMNNEESFYEFKEFDWTSGLAKETDFLMHNKEEEELNDMAIKSLFKKHWEEENENINMWTHQDITRTNGKKSTEHNEEEEERVNEQERKEGTGTNIRTQQTILERLNIQLKYGSDESENEIDILKENKITEEAIPREGDLYDSMFCTPCSKISKIKETPQKIESEKRVEPMKEENTSKKTNDKKRKSPMKKNNTKETKKKSKTNIEVIVISDDDIQQEKSINIEKEPNKSNKVDKNEETDTKQIQDKKDVKIESNAHNSSIEGNNVISIKENSNDKTIFRNEIIQKTNDKEENPIEKEDTNRNNNNNNNNESDKNLQTSNNVIIQCEDCEISPKSKIEPIKNEKTNNVCVLCQIGFASQRVLLRHYKTIHTDQRPYKCDICEKEFKRSDHLRKHKSIHIKMENSNLENEPSKFLHCVICDIFFTSRKELNNHKITHKQCTYEGCTYKFSSISQMKYHLNKHKHKAFYSCPSCHEQIIQYKEFIEHKKKCYTTVYACMDCNTVYKSRNAYKRHCNIEHLQKKQTYVCTFPDCNKRFNSSYSLKEHVLAIHEQIKRHHCDKCNMYFSYKSSFIRHNLNIHNERSQ